LKVTGTCGELRRELGVYLLGAIAPAERSTVERHLAACTSCRNQLAELAGLPGLLRRVPVQELDSQRSADAADNSSTLPEWLLESLLRHTARRRRYRVWSRVIAPWQPRD
jgi:anti-sigma factor RsiW